MKDELLRYSCQIALPQFLESGQQKLKDAKVLIVGAGGLGCPSSQYLAAAGVGTLGIADFDVISIGNLHRQILFNADEVGKKKAVIAAKKLSSQNPQIKIVGLDKKITSNNAISIIDQYDIVIDGTDNFETKYLLNDACVLTGKPLIHGAIYQYEGQLAVWNVKNSDGSYSPHLRDIFPEVDASAIPNCTEGGVIPTLAGIIGCMQANEAIKLITGAAQLMKSKLLLFDARDLSSRTINLQERSGTIVKGLLQTFEIPQLNVLIFKKNFESFDIIDVRTHEERTSYNIGGRHIPIAELNYETLLSDVQKPLLFICASGKRSAEAVKQILRINPGADVFSLEGGLKAYRESITEN